MVNILEWSVTDWVSFISDTFRYVLKRWYVLLIGALAAGGLGYLLKKDVKPEYTSTISFVLSTESKATSSGLAGLSAQLGLDAGTGGTENVFSGDNIIELFKSRKMISQALLSEANPETHQSLLNYVASTKYPEDKAILPFPARADQFTPEQKVLFDNIIVLIDKAFSAFKKDKKLVFYYITATSDDGKIAFYTAKNMLDQTSRFFIETKTSAAIRGLKLLEKEADSISRVLGGTFHSTASMADRTFNVNPSMMIQRSGAQLNGAKAVALGAAYTEVMRNLEVARINLQKESPLFSIIDEPQLPLAPKPFALTRYCIILALAGLFLTAAALFAIRIYFTIIKHNFSNNVK